MTEIWRSVKNFEGTYEVSSIGRVKSLARLQIQPYGGRYEIKETIRKSHIVGGYIQVALSREGKSKFFKVHRLVADVFIDNPFNKPQVNHKDGNKLNNKIDNLEWVTCSENLKHAFLNGLKFPHTGANHQNSKLVLNKLTVVFYDTMTQAFDSQSKFGRPSFHAMMSGRNPNKTDFIYV